MTPQRIARQGAWLLPLWVALLGADRVDLLGGRGPVVLTPFLVLTAPVCAVELAARRARRGASWRRFPAAFAAQAALLFLLVGIAALSTINSLDATVTVQRTLLLVAQAGGASLVIWALSDDADGPHRLALGATLGITLALLADVGQGLAFVGWLPFGIDAWGRRWLDLQPFNYAGLIPRFSGLALDPNRAAYIAILQVALVHVGQRRGRGRWLALGSLTLLLTLSRSGLLAALTAAALTALMRRRGLGPVVERGARDAGAWRRLVLALLAAAVSAALLILPSLRGDLARTFAPAVERFSAAEGSARIHADLMRQGAAEATRDVPRMLLGTGYGTSFLLLRDVFGTRYGNYHSLYLSFWVEAGIVALLVVLLLFVLPAPHAGRWLALLGASAVFNVFYQAGTEPALWAALALAWQEGAT